VARTRKDVCFRAGRENGRSADSGFSGAVGSISSTGSRRSWPRDDQAGALRGWRARVRFAATEGGRDGNRRLPDLWSLAGQPAANDANASPRARPTTASPPGTADRLKPGQLEPLVLSPTSRQTPTAARMARRPPRRRSSAPPAQSATVSFDWARYASASRREG
jgi:hypothetical protein